ncbi:MAG TPA: DUF488 family protein [Burkholderiales bacterium]|nr:DUF488 family protein [Burkholderiales bacterium]
MALRVVRLGSARQRGEGLRIGTARRPPRGVRKADYARRNFYDVWLPELAPSQKWVSWALAQPWTDARWRKYARNYRREMREPRAERLMELLAALSHGTNLSIGCYCENEARCHRSLLRQLLAEKGAKLA